MTVLTKVACCSATVTHTKTYSHRWWCCSAARWRAAGARHSAGQPESCHSCGEHSPPCGTESHCHRRPCMPATHQAATGHHTGPTNSCVPMRAWKTVVLVLSFELHIHCCGTLVPFFPLISWVDCLLCYVENKAGCSLEPPQICNIKSE